MKLCSRAVYLSLIAPIAMLFVSCGSGGMKITPTPTPTPVPSIKPKFAYTANQNSASISGFSVDPDSGVLTPLAGFPIASGVNPNFIIHDPSGKYIVVTDIAADQLRVYSLDAVSGNLQEVSGSPFSTGREPRSLVFDPSGKYLYVASQDLNSIAAFSMDASTGALTAVKGSPFATTGTNSFGCCVAVTPDGQFLFAADLDNVYSYRINADTGELTLIGTVAGPKVAGGLIVDPTGKYAYAVGSGTNTILSFAIDQTSGTISLLASSSMVEDDGAYTIAVDPTGQFAYTVEAGDTLVAYTVKDGKFTPSGVTYPTALGSLQVVVDPSGSFVYAPQTGTANDISAWHISSTTGYPTPIAGAPFATGKAPLSITITRQ